MMSWSESGDVSVSHSREPWGGLIAPKTIVHCQLERLKGTASSLGRQGIAYAAAYQAAKSKFRIEMALDIVERCASGDALDRLADVVVECGAAPIFVLPHPPFDDEQGIGHQHTHVVSKPTNALPFAYAAFLAQTLGGSVDGEIVQASRVGRTQLNRWLRFLCQPSFCGNVSTEQPYIIVDDVVSTGGTLAALRSYIVACGGRVIATTSIADAQGRDRPLESVRNDYC